jgi:hypothetical protein
MLPLETCVDPFGSWFLLQWFACPAACVNPGAKRAGEIGRKHQHMIVHRNGHALNWYESSYQLAHSATAMQQ